MLARIDCNAREGLQLVKIVTLKRKFIRFIEIDLALLSFETFVTVCKSDLENASSPFECKRGQAGYFSD